MERTCLDCWRFCCRWLLQAPFSCYFALRNSDTAAVDTVYRWKNIGCDAFRTLNIERYTVKRAITFIVSLQCFLSLIICITLLLTWTDHCYSLDIKWVCRIFTLELSHIVFGVLFFDQSKYIDIAIEALNLRHLAIYFMRLIQNNKNSALERLFVT